jgi:UDP-N-acetylglucosamine/UDP-N-acetylgalactosamine diphosphorylase
LSADPCQNPSTIEELRACFARHAQAHVFDHWERLSGVQRDALLDQAARLAPELPALIEAHRAATEDQTDAPLAAVASEIEPANAIELPEHGGDPKRFETARALGNEVLRAGRVGVFLVAGGQGTRLGFPHPKGCFPVGPVSDRTLFELQAQKIRGLGRRIGHTVPWYIMTSDATDQETREAFEANNFFGLDPEDVKIFRQDMVPAFDFDGRLLLEEAGRIFESPNGHGGALTALSSSGALADMERRGVDILYYYQVDNPLVKIGDPTYIGFHVETGAEMSCKVVRKSDPMEKVGVLVNEGGRVTMVEYTELADEQRYAKDERGQLRFWAGSVAIHVLNVDFIKTVASRAFDLLPFHLSEKKIPFIDDRGSCVEPDAPNGHKLERFVFDALAAARGVCVLETTAEDEFFPIKNATGRDSPETSRQALTAQVRRWLSAGGIDVPAEVDRIEVDHSQIDGPEDVVESGFQCLSDAGDVIRTAGGRD